ncbi:MAG: hypothetical protein AB7G28_03190 [Pirellulales bacterium]
MRSTLLIIAVWSFPAFAYCQANDPIYRFPEPAHSPVPLFASDYCFTQDHPSTAAEGLLRGLAAWTHSQGNYLVNRQQAAILYEYVRHLEILNKHSRAEWNDWKRARREKKVQAKREKNLASRAVRLQTAYELNVDELDRSTGTIFWPQALQAPQYAQQRERLDELYRRQAGYDNPTPSDARAIVAECDRLIRQSNHDRTKIAASDHSAAQRFLRGLKYEPLFRLQVN